MSNYYALKNNSIFNPPPGQSPSEIDFTGSSNVALGNVANVHITGGDSSQVLTTDGTGNLSWLTPSVGPTVSQIQITDSSYNVIDDTAVSTSGGYIKITGSGFSAGAIVVVGNINATSTTFVSSSVLNVQIPSAVAGTYTVYVVNTNGSTAIAVNGLTYSGTPNWVTGSTLPNGVSNTPISIQLSATGDAPLTYALAAGNSLPSGLTLSSSGLLSGTVTVASETVYAFTIIATDAEAQDSPRAFTITITVGDPYFYLTTLLLPGNGTNNGTNNTFLDSSSNALTVTRNGNTTQGTFTPYSLTGWSNFFDGNGDYLTLADNAAFGLGTGDFTVECFIWLTSYPGSGVYNILDFRTSATGQPWVWNINTSGNLGTYTSGSDVAGSIPIGTNQWTHVAITRSSGTVKQFVGGSVAGSGTITTDLGSSRPLTIASIVGGGSSQVNGYISNLRIVKGTALYTNTFTPPTAPLTSVSGTSLLTCQSNSFKDNSTNNFAITKVGDVSVQSFSPFAPGSSYSTSIVGGSAYFDGSGDYLSLAGNAVFGFGTGDFAIEMWFYRTSTSGTATLYDSRASDGVVVELLADGGIGIYRNLAGNNVQSAPAGSYKFQTWHHFVTTRLSNQWRTFIDGVSVAGPTSDSNNLGSTNNVNIGIGISGSSNPFTGYISSLRVLKGTGYSTVTVPTAPYTNIANTSLLLNFTNGQITDATSKNLLETIADAKISTAQSKWGGSSMYFDGNDYLVAPSSQNFALGTGDYTIEAWVYPTSIRNGENLVYATDVSGGVTFGYSQTQIYIGARAVAYDLQATYSMSANTWTHIAAARQNGTVRIFANGNLVGSGSVTRSCPQGPGGVGDYPTLTGNGVTGYINDLRVTKGYARYTANFTPPNNAFPAL